MPFKSTLAIFELMLCGSTAMAQTPAVPVISPVAPVGMAVLRTGTEVPLRLSEPLSTEHKQLRVGQRFHLEVAEPVTVNGVVVVPVGTPAVGEITDVRNKGMWGKSGHLAARVLYMEVGNRQIRLSGTFDDKGVTGTGAVVAAVVFVPVVGFFTTGTSARISSGATVKGFVDEDVPLNFAVSAAAPLTVAAPSAPLTISAAAAAGTPVAGATVKAVNSAAPQGH